MGLLPFSITPADMNWTQRKKSDPCPQSAVGHGVGLAGLAGLLLWIAVARHFGMDGPYAGMAGVFACGVPMVRSEEHTSELQSLMRISYAVFCLKKKK